MRETFYYYKENYSLLNLVAYFHIERILEAVTMTTTVLLTVPHRLLMLRRFLESIIYLRRNF